MMFAGLLTAFLLVVTGIPLLIERIGADRPADLSRANDGLQREIADRKTAEKALQQNEDGYHVQRMNAVGAARGRRRA